MCFVKFLAFLNICTAIVAIIFQIATLSRFYHPNDMELEKVGIGIWGGLIFMAAGVLNWISDDKDQQDRAYRRFGGIFAVLSLLVSIVMVGIFAGQIADVKDNHLCTIHTHEYQCDIHLALDGVLLFAGGFALVVNTALSFLMCYCAHPDNDKY